MVKQAEYGDNPFKPAPGEMPPYLAGRDGVLADWRGNWLKSGRFKTPEILMYGPRGTGKTAILGEFQRIANERGCNVVRASTDAMEGGKQAMADEMLSEFEAASYIDSETTTAAARGEGGVPGVAKAGASAGHSRTSKHRDPVAALPLADRLRAVARQKPLVVLVDEAHAAEGDAELKSLRALANAVQQLVNEQEVAICLVLAGTPGLPRMPIGKGGTFMGRFHRIGVGLLDEESAREAIRRPLADTIWRENDSASRLRIEAPALNEAARDSGCYPHFLQLWGSALWEQAKARGADVLTVEDVEAARESVAAERLIHYKDRRGEINHDDDLLTAANAVAEAFEKHYATRDDQWIRDSAIDNAVERALTPAYPLRRELNAAAKRCMERLIHLGFVWDPPKSPRMEPGIPSFLSYAQTLYAERLGHLQLDADKDA